MACLWQIFFHVTRKFKVITLAALTLHNWLKIKSYIFANLVDREDLKTGKVLYGTLR